MKDDLSSNSQSPNELQDPRGFFAKAFARNIGLIFRTEQEQLRQSTVGIPGLGGVGGVHLVTLARTGIGRFHICDFDQFEIQNFNRQYGAKVSTLGESKLEVMKREALDINPHLELKCFSQGIDASNVDAFLDGLDIVVDSLDFFAFDARRTLFTRAQERGIPVITAGPIGFTTAMLIFVPGGMTFDRYFDIHDDLSATEKTMRYQFGLAPNLHYLKAFDLAAIDHRAGAGPSLGLACQLCGSAAAAEVLRILLKRGRPKAVPHYTQIDLYSRRYIHGWLPGGNRNPLQKLKLATFRANMKRIQENARPVPPLPTRKEAGLSKEAFRYLVSAGTCAPSGDNCQPWKFSREGDRIRLHLDRNSDRCLFNHAQLASAIACGAALENISIAATALGREANVQHLPFSEVESEEPFPCIATIELRQSEAAPSPLVTSVWRRHTNRKPFARRPLVDAARDIFKEVETRFPGVRLHVIQDREQLKRLAGTVCLADRLRVENKELHEHLYSMIRFSDAEVEAKPDGLPLHNLEAGTSGEMFLRLTRPWRVMSFLNRIGIGKTIPKIASQGLIESSAAVLITVPNIEFESFVLGGRALENLWLSASYRGLSAQLMNALPLFRNIWQLGRRDVFQSHQQLIDEVWRRYKELFPDIDFEREGHVALIRLGYSAAPVIHRTRRKPEDSFLIE